ncbi:prepilin-type N-terminal cleavage/methylation domain-containing protein [Bacillus ginsengihumi]|uniref:Pilus assembly protein n=1 Tax=Heyndrickxia ginsengihumi TaxID=363870 RepID=A0A0A6VF68_9BACI|nr:prepilin-type N-terminal cleavage/methylation domain-containing protein [Heyndrickxia ginsengihumi]KHD86885.1 pilus assembly protein [Heyndrickxia ginsengihumi]NEY20422.1 prepilin-type N-terminal cleavage/methylation domain-containing protein [Heyndrickxia ginsengihumi]
MLRKKRKLLKSEKGFTLIELLAVIVILAIIAAIAIPAIGNIIKNSRIDAIKSDATQVLEAAKLYEASNNDAGSATNNTTTLDKDKLSSYLDDNDVSKLQDGYSVTVTEDSTSHKLTYKITATGKDGSVTVNFKDATLNDINSAKKGATDIPAQ